METAQSDKQHCFLAVSYMSLQVQTSPHDLGKVDWQYRHVHIFVVLALADFLPASQITLTVVIFVLATFLLGFVADPIINLYQDPYSTLTGDPLVPVFDNVGPLTWPEHMAKGLAGLGLVGFAKFVFTLGPWNWLNATRGTGLFGGNRGGATGRDRMQQLSWLTIAIGVLAFLWVSLHRV